MDAMDEVLNVNINKNCGIKLRKLQKKQKLTILMIYAKNKNDIRETWSILEIKTIVAIICKQ